MAVLSSVFEVENSNGFQVLVLLLRSICLGFGLFTWEWCHDFTHLIYSLAHASMLLIFDTSWGVPASLRLFAGTWFNTFLYILNVSLCQTSSGIWLQIIGPFISANRSIRHCWCWSSVENQMWPSTTALALLCGVLIDGLCLIDSSRINVDFDLHLIPCAIINWVTRSTIVCIDMRRRLHSIQCILSQVWTPEVVTSWWDA